MDCAVMETLHQLRQEEGKPAFDTVRGLKLLFRASAALSFFSSLPVEPVEIPCVSRITWLRTFGCV
jgi:hypothetical protein